MERYGRWLAGALAAAGRLAEDGVTFGLKARAGGEVVRTGDGVSAAWVAACGRYRWRWARYVRGEKRALAAARRVIATSPMVQSELTALYGQASHLLLNPVLNPVATPTPAAEGALVFVGHGFARKGLDRWLALLAVLPGRSGHVIGHDAHLPRWRRQAERLGLGARVTFHGAVEAGPWVAGAAVLVHPARYEPYGNVIAEAVAAGTPVVASAHTGATCLLDPRSIWHPATGLAGLRAQVTQALAAPLPPRLHPPTAEAHLAALLALVAR